MNESAGVLAAIESGMRRQQLGKTPMRRGPGIYALRCVATDEVYVGQVLESGPDNLAWLRAREAHWFHKLGATLNGHPLPRPADDISPAQAALALAEQRFEQVCSTAVQDAAGPAWPAMIAAAASARDAAALEAAA